MATLKQIIKETQSQVTANQEQILPGSKVVSQGPSRSYPSATAAWEDGIGYTPPFVGTNQTFRPNWRTLDVAVQQNKVITTKLPDASIAKGIIQNPSMTSAKLVSVPDVTVAVVIPGHSGDVNKGGGQIQINWHVSAGLSVATAQASFALFRDGVQIGPTVYGATPNNGGKFSVAQTFIDTPGNGLHSYAVYWATSAGTLTGDGIGRFIHALPLRPL